MVLFGFITNFLVNIITNFLVSQKKYEIIWDGESKINLHNGTKLNFKKVKSNVFVQKGDVIVFDIKGSDTFLYLNTFLKNKTKFTKFYSFVEYDLYTKTIV